MSVVIPTLSAARAFLSKARVTIAHTHFAQPCARNSEPIYAQFLCACSTRHGLLVQVRARGGGAGVVPNGCRGYLRGVAPGRQRPACRLWRMLPG